MLIDYQNVNIYQADTLVLENVNFHVDEGEFIISLVRWALERVHCSKPCIANSTWMRRMPRKPMFWDAIWSPSNAKKCLLWEKRWALSFKTSNCYDRNVYKNLRFVLKATGWKDKAEIDEHMNEVLNDVGLLERRKVCLMNFPEENNNVSPSLWAIPEPSQNDYRWWTYR